MYTRINLPHTLMKKVEDLKYPDFVRVVNRDHWIKIDKYHRLSPYKGDMMYYLIGGGSSSSPYDGSSAHIGKEYQMYYMADIIFPKEATPEQKSPEWIVGKWYRNPGCFPGSDITWAKYSSHVGTTWNFSEWIDKGIYKPINSWWYTTGGYHTPVKITEIERYLPEDHPDRNPPVPVTEEPVEYVKCTAYGANTWGKLSGFTLTEGRIYKFPFITDDVGNTRDINPHMCMWVKEFTPSTKEAYDKQKEVYDKQNEPKAEMLRVGDIVRIVRGFPGETKMIGRVGTLTEIDGSVIPYRVQLDKSTAHWCEQVRKASFLDIATEKPYIHESGFKVGDAVYICDDHELTNIRSLPGTITEIDDSKIPFRVKLEEGGEFWCKQVRPRIGGAPVVVSYPRSRVSQHPAVRPIQKPIKLARHFKNRSIKLLTK
jgi:transcription antitermination factor NusG